MPSTTIQKKKMTESEFGSGNPATHYLGISLTLPTATGANITEPSSSSGYARVAITNNKATWTDFASGEISNKIAFAFPEVKNSNWNTSTTDPLYLFLATSATGSGNTIIHWFEITGRLIQVNSTLTIPIGSYKVKM